MPVRTLFAALMLLTVPPAAAQTAWPNLREGDFVIKDFRFASGEILPELKLHYRTLGTARRNDAGEIINGVVLLHGTSGSGADWLRPSLGDELFGTGQPLDASKYFIVLPDGIGRGGSSKPSDGLRAKFPHYRYYDIVAAEHKLVTEHLNVRHLRLVLGSSMGGMHSWMWGYLYPDLMDGVVPIASQPVQVSGKNWIQRRVAIEAIRNDPDWNGGNYTKNPSHYIYTVPYGFVQTENVVQIQNLAPTQAAADELKARHELELRGIEAHARQRLAEAVAEGQKVAGEIRAQAQKEAQDRLARAEDEMMREREKSKELLKEQVIGLSLKTAEKILRTKLDDPAQRKLAGEFIDEVGALK